tara:strand:+ start:328 stop:528 length:201 start_codon:yes stop_codon:yes gene_type:complete
MFTTLPQSVIIRKSIIIGNETRKDIKLEFNLLNLVYLSRIIRGPNPNKMIRKYRKILSKLNKTITA